MRHFGRSKSRVGIFSLWSLTIIHTCYALDVNVSALLPSLIGVTAFLKCCWQWIPGDADGPLPLSKDFRDKLSGLCKILEQGGRVDVSKERHATIKRMCAKLRDLEEHQVGARALIPSTFQPLKQLGAGATAPKQAGP